MALTLDGLAIGNGILTVENEAQAIVRADPAQGDKGGDAAQRGAGLLELKNALRLVSRVTDRCDERSAQTPSARLRRADRSAMSRWRSGRGWCG